MSGSVRWPGSRVLCGVLALAAVWALAAGCGGGAAAGDGSSARVAELAEALRGDDPARVYAMLSSELRAEISFDDFAAQWRASESERRARAARLQQGLEADAEVAARARVTLSGGGVVFLVREGEGWRVDSALSTVAAAGDPWYTVARLSRALTTRDLEAVLQVLSERRREEVDDALGDLAASLAIHLDDGRDTLEMLEDDRAVLRWDHGLLRYELLLVKEGELWRVDDLRMRVLPGDGDD
ncbi:hypothetical protein [Haliangium ochraceum]|uniref:Lipoprotein n=1 Tax=Haliangium ochraceum (strain DSM 14365 / JCM 11303 / SMP-2) TaxID=502025 RepID=D0LPX9_HALO1|nr:hypothetical protein [Haliangium ochraceum]ACY17016.1 hypothetical protein Hoch_4523 [Haliangium ochraceum DSM 14365]